MFYFIIWASVFHGVKMNKIKTSPTHWTRKQASKSLIKTLISVIVYGRSWWKSTTNKRFAKKIMERIVKDIWRLVDRRSYWNPSCVETILIKFLLCYFLYKRSSFIAHTYLYILKQMYSFSWMYGNCAYCLITNLLFLQIPYINISF